MGKEEKKKAEKAAMKEMEEKKEKKDKDEKKEKKEKDDKKEKKEKDDGEKKPRRIQPTAGGFDLWDSTEGDSTNNKYNPNAGKVADPQDKRAKQEAVEKDKAKNAAAGKNMLSANDVLAGMIKEKKEDEKKAIQQ